VALPNPEDDKNKNRRLNLNRSALLILVALAVLLSAQSPSPGVGTEPASQRTDSSQQNSQSERNPPTAETVPNAIQSEAPHENSGQIASQKEADFVQVGPVDIHKDWLDRSYVAFSFLLVVVGIMQAALLKQQGKVTRAALHINRPFLIVPMPEIKVSPETVENSLYHVPRYVTVSAENFGTGPADIVDVSLCVTPFDLPTDPKITYRPEERRQPNVPILGAGKSDAIIGRDIDLGRPRDILAVVEWKRRLGVYGEVRYRGGPPDQIYVTHFFWWYFPSSPKGQDFARASDPELNSRT
jgi:hypothetical protein